MIDPAEITTRGLLKLFAGVLDELRRREVVRSANNPVGDYTEHLVAERLGLTLGGNSSAGYDAVDAAGHRYQIKGRRVTTKNGSTQLSALRNLAGCPFDSLIAVIYHSDFTVAYAAKIPHDVVVELARYRAHTNSHCLMMPRRILADPRVTDLTAVLVG